MGVLQHNTGNLVGGSSRDKGFVYQVGFTRYLSNDGNMSTRNSYLVG